MNGDWLSLALASAATRMLEQRLVTKVVVPNPGAGNEWIVTVPGGVSWEILSVRATFATSAVVVTRRPFFYYQDADANRLVTIDNNVTQTANVTGSLTLIQGMGTTITGSNQTLPLPTPPIPMQSGYTFRSVTSNLDAGDAWTGIILLVREWSETEVVYSLMDIARQIDSLTSSEVTGRKM